MIIIDTSRPLEEQDLEERYPVFPSARVVVVDAVYMEAHDALKAAKVKDTFFDGESILVPESNPEAIAMLKDRFFAKVELGFGERWKFATLAKQAKLPSALIRIGDSLDRPPEDAEAMVADSLRDPRGTYAEWVAEYRRAMGHPEARAEDFLDEPLPTDLDRARHVVEALQEARITPGLEQPSPTRH